MSRSLHYMLLAGAILAPLRAANPKLVIRDDVRNAETLFGCLSRTAVELFNDGNRIGVICYECGYLENEVIRMFMKSRTTVVSNRPLYIRNRRAVSYVVFATETFAESRRGLLEKRGHLHLVQYLFVSTAEQRTVIAFADELWRAGFRDIAFLTLDGESGRGIVQMPVMNRTINLRSMGNCSRYGNSLEIVPYSSNFYRFCQKHPCTLLHGAVLDDTVQFWREEDKLGQSETESYASMGKMLINRFTSFFGIVPRLVSDNLTWPEAAERLINGQLDMALGLMPENLHVLEDLEVVCWYRDRALKFAAPVRKRLRDYPVLQLLTPFQYTVWICLIVALLLYILLLYVLARLAGMGLIRERLRFVQIYEIMLNQDTASPRRTSLRAVLALWMIFSLNVSIIYNSTFTSSLADLDTEDLLKDLKELRASGRSICGPPIVQNVLNESDDPVIADLRDRYIVMKRAQEALDAMMSNNTMGVVQRTTVDRLNWATRTDRRLRIYSLPKPVLTFPVLFYTKAGHPYRVPFERIVTEYRESGFLHKWIKYYVIEEDKEIANSQEDEDDGSGGILSMDHLGPVFNLFFMCQAISVLVFLIELFRYYVPKVSAVAA